MIWVSSLDGGGVCAVMMFMVLQDLEKKMGYIQCMMESFFNGSGDMMILFDEGE